MIQRFGAWLTMLLWAAFLCIPAGPASAAFPDRPITLIVPWAAGGGTDAIARTIAAALERDMGVPVNVVNRTGGSGVVGHTAIASAPPDGYTIGLITLEINMMHWVGLTKLTYEGFTPLALMNADPAAIHVRIDSPHKTLKELVTAIKANPGKLKASGTGQGGSWHLALAGMLKSQGIEPAAVPWVPSTGAATALTDLAAAGLDFVSCSLPEADALTRAGKIRSIGLMADKRAKNYPDVPTLSEAIGSDWKKGVWRGMAGPKGLPREAAARYEAALKAIYEGKAFQDFMSSRGFEPVWADAARFSTFMTKDNAEIGDILKEMGLAK
ncbi:tripartite tricarboxylate transporter substrate binding protein [uncultured Enterovirga sp.]|uniref:tripartite tricarboxylate transporter substrate binding protein n=1 Tax=uncultured Enterovirga sp. TaxID=2026352 RepID=UPI0035C96CD6